MGSIIGREIRRYEQVASTNDLARQAGARGEPEGLVVSADEQTAGRGRLGRQWLAPPGSSIQLSGLLRPPLAAAEAFRLTQMAALAVAATLRNHLHLDPELKWPNDVLLRGKKCAGILIETALEGERIEFAIVGIGLNVNFAMELYPEFAPFATTLSDELGRLVDRPALETALLDQLDAYYGRLRRGEPLHDEWIALMSTIGEAVHVATSEGIETGVAEGVDRDGALLLRSGERLFRLYAGDVTIVKALPGKRPAKAQTD